eukprot:gb/GECG01006552.1/.p1 GENE.gb/GECG01006552.1/~~gb/GECG01006552.1/.p1  ORF type:complete len:325 (+),score=21.38 gb/GECG01006552.1/:1-975(+)
MSAYREELNMDSAYADPDQEVCDVFTKRDILHDAARNRDVPITVYYPLDRTGAKFPVIIWSHGHGGSRDGSAFLHRYHASHGYIVVGVQHLGTDTSVWQGQVGDPLEIIRNSSISREATLARFKDIPFVLDSLPTWAIRNPEAGNRMNLQVIGMSGHSFGALTTQVMAGQSIGRGGRFMPSQKENRFRAGIAYSPSLPAFLVDNPAPFVGTISLPMLYMTGTADSSPRTQQDYTSRMKVYEHCNAQDQYLLVLNGGDHMVFSDRRPYRGIPPTRDTHERIIKLSSLAFWDAFLKNSDAALYWLRSSGLSTFAGPHASYVYKNPS